MSFPLVVSFYTENTPYEEEANRLLASCRRFGIESYIAPLPTTGSWVTNCAQKGPFIQRCLQEFKRPIVWLDADAEIVQYPILLEKLECDFAAYVPKYLVSGTLFFSASKQAIALANRWAALCVRLPTTWDQKLLDKAMRQVKATTMIHRLPQGYCKIMGRPWREGEIQEAVIIHHQASRRLKTAVYLDA